MEITVIPYNWEEKNHEIEDEEGGTTYHYTIRMWTLNRESQPCLVRIEDFEPFVFVKLPESINTKSKLSGLMSYLMNGRFGRITKYEYARIIGIHPCCFIHNEHKHNKEELHE